MVKKKIIVGNWKMNPLSSGEAEKLFTDIVKSVHGLKKTEMVICPPSLYLEKLKSASWRTKKVFLGAQNAFWGDIGAFTGEVSVGMLYCAGVRYVILGHSECRALGEDNGEINKKIKSSLSSGLIPILCLGENMRDENHDYFNTVKTQMVECLNGISKLSISKVVIAYEPVWAISSTPNRADASPEDFLEMSIFIRKIIADKFGIKTKMPRIIYGGSVNDKNVTNFIKHEGVDGVLVGQASLDAKKFSEIIKICEASGK